MLTKNGEKREGLRCCDSRRGGGTAANGCCWCYFLFFFLVLDVEEEEREVRKHEKVKGFGVLLLISFFLSIFPNSKL